MSGELGNFLFDLVSIEVNTIVKEGMTAEKMPEPWVAVHDVLVSYVRYLDQAELEGPTLPGALADLYGREFGERLAAIAGATTAQREASPGPARAAILDRMLRNIAMVEALRARKPRELSLKDRMALRKMWEIGTEHVVVQTCISLDGDVVTRIDPQLLAKPTELREVLLGVHRESTSISIRFWSGLVEAATNLIGGLRRWGSSSSSGTGA